VRRRAFIGLIGGAAAWPGAARSQQAGARDRVAWVHPSAPLTDLKEDGGVRAYRAFLHELRQLGHVEGANLILERYSAEGRLDRYEELARNDVVESRPSVIFTSGAEFARRLKAATSAIPIVAILTDPVATGLPMTRLH